MTLETIMPRHRDLQQVSIQIDQDFACIAARNRAAVEEQIERANPGMRWSDLDRFLIKLWESRAIRTTVIYSQPEIIGGEREMKDWVMYLLPELTKREIVDLVEEPFEYEYDR